MIILNAMIMNAICHDEMFTHLWKKHTGSPPVSQRTPAHKSLRSCQAQTWRGWWGTLQGEDRCGCTPLAGWWRSRSALLNSCAGRSSSSGALAFCQSTGKWHTCSTVTWGRPLPSLWPTTFLYCVYSVIFSTENWTIMQQFLWLLILQGKKCLHLCIHTSSGS